MVIAATVIVGATMEAPNRNGPASTPAPGSGNPRVGIGKGNEDRAGRGDAEDECLDLLHRIVPFAAYFDC
jgi:hypothetical protein